MSIYVTFSSSNYKLLTSEMFTDCEVVCEEKVWKLHRNILCSRTGYFQGALCKSFTESEARRVVLTEWTKEQVGMLIDFIYTGELCWDILRIQGTILHKAFQLWIIGDYFLIPELCSQTLDYLENHHVPDNARVASSIGFKLAPTDWQNAGELLYSYFPADHKLKSVFLEISLGKSHMRRKVINLPEFKVLATKYPEFGRDCMVKLVEDNVTRLQ
ncbi:Kelch-like protein 38 [Colletotrichum sidae]|uniref:Kelch-like protein 38 n=1 Tax=Colletotrichum sidae TaxID=1347389 RepID=A0A4R8TTH7_9PEZI|nr:Kelch-like protein 38 [Colletotrichum sidae]